MSNMTTFGQWLKQRRKALGLTQKELAQRAGCAEISLRKIEAGDLHPSAPLVASLAGVVGAVDADLPGLLSLARGADDNFTARARLQRAQRPNNLPAQLTPLIGREHDIAAVRKRLLSDGVRLITLPGPPGVGKTRLALAVAEEVLEQFGHGAFFVRLGPVSDPTLVAAAIAQALGMEMSGPNPPALQLRAWLEEKHLLLVLDNFEHVVEAAPLVDDLLRRCPWLHVLVTSRQPLRVRGERQISVRPLPLPIAAPKEIPVTAEEMLRYPAVALFAERAEAVQPDFAVDDDNTAAVAELCRRLDGLPLAIELVAARVKLLPPAELLLRLRGPWLLSTDGLRDVSERQRTLRGAIGWSYDLLSPVEQTLFVRLAVFVGGCTLEAAEMICEDVLSPGQVLAGIASLLDKSLLNRETGLYDEPRYAMLETMREYGLELLAANRDETAIRTRHAHCFIRSIGEIERKDLHPVWLQRWNLIDCEIHNIRSALAWTMKHEVQSALLLAAFTLEWLITRGTLAEGQQMIADTFALPGAEIHTIPRARVLWAAGMLMFHRSDLENAQAYLAESLVVSQEISYEKGEADALTALGRIANRQSYDQSSALHHQERALSLYRALGDVDHIAYALVLLAQTCMYQGDFVQARALCEESFAVAHQVGYYYAWPLYQLGFVCSHAGELDEAQSLHRQALPVLREQRNMGLLAYTLTDLGSIAIREGKFMLARGYLEEVLAIHKNLGSIRTADIMLPWAELHWAEGDYTQAIQLYRASLATMIEDRGSSQNQFLLGLATVANRLGHYEVTARLLGASHTLDEAVQPFWPIEREDYNRLFEATRVSLGAKRFDAAWMEGRVVVFETAAVEALTTLERVLRAPE